MNFKSILLPCLILLFAACADDAEYEQNTTQDPSDNMTSTSTSTAAMTSTSVATSTSRATTSVMTSGTTTSEVPTDMGTGQQEEMGQEPDQSVTTLSIDGVTVEKLTETEATIFWELSEVAKGRIEYGEDDTLGMQTKGEESFKYDAHRQTIKDLKPGTTYHFQVISTDREGVEVRAQIQTFTTLGEQGGGLWPPASFEVSVPAQSLPYPDYLVPVKTSVPNVTVTRITDNSDKVNGTRHQYSRRQVWNRDETLMLLSSDVYDAKTYKKISSISLGDRNWSNTEPSMMFGISSGNRFAKQNVRTGALEVLHTFEGYTDCTLGGWEGSVTLDDKLVAISCKKGSSIYLLSYNIKQDSVLGTLKMRGDYNWASFSPLGTYVIVENNDPNTSTNEELLRFSPQLDGKKLLTRDRNHGDLGLDNEGNEVFVMISWDYITYVRLKDGAKVRLGVSTKSNGSGHGHVSCRNFDRPGRCYISSNRGFIGSVQIGIANPSSIGKTDTGAPLYRGLSGWELWGHHRSKKTHYNTSAKGSVSYSGTKMIVSTDWDGKKNGNSLVFSVE